MAPGIRVQGYVCIKLMICVPSLHFIINFDRHCFYKADL